MTYVMSDLHGEYEKYVKMLKKLDLKPEDRLFILGDFVDRGCDGVKILLDVMERDNVIALTGNHDRTMALLMLNREVLLQKLGKEEVDKLFLLWFSDGGETTYRELSELNETTRARVFQFVAKMACFAEVSAGGRTFFLSHTLPPYQKGINVRELTEDEYLYGRADYDRVYDPELTMVTGHTPTGLIDPEYAGRIYRVPGHIALDCGAAFGNPLGCICLDTMEEIYVG